MAIQTFPAARPRIAMGLVLVALGATIGCTKFEIWVDRAPDADFARYRTFNWIPISAAPPEDQDTGDRDLTKRIYEAVESQLEGKHYAPAAVDVADLLVTFRLVRDDVYDEAHLPYATQWRRGAYQDALHASPDTYDRGTLIIDVIDRKANALVWRGSATARLLPHTSYEAGVKRADAAVEQILATFPAR